MALKRTSIVLCLIRGGETAWDGDGRVHGSTDLPLSDAGLDAVTADAARLKGVRFSTVHHPPDEAGGQTAELFARAAGAKAKPVDELADPDLGLLEGLLRQDFAERYPKRYRQWQDDPLTLSPPEGEEIAEARARIFAALARVLRRSRSEEVAVVLHSLGLGLLRSWLADRPAGDLWAMLRGRDRVERYALTGEMIEWLEDATRVEYSGS